MLKQSKEMIASGFDRLMLNEFDMLEEYSEFTEKHLADTTEKFKQCLQKELSNIEDKEDRAGYVDYMNGRFIELEETFPKLQRYAQFLVVYSFFEHSLNQLCDIVKNRSNYKLSVKDMAGHGIRRAANYLGKVASVDKPFKSPAWQNALLLGDIRNAIAHRNGKIEFTPKKNDSLASRVKILPGIKLKQLVQNHPDAEIILNPEFVKNSLEIFKQVLTDVANYEL